MERKSLKPFEISCKVNEAGNSLIDLAAPSVNDISIITIYDKIVFAYNNNFHIYLQCDLTKLLNKP
jgi:hypothetical protein